jgi:uncharacterized protein (AIM24 family)
MNTHTSGGLGSMFKRLMGGSSMFVTDYTYSETEGFGRVAFAEVFLLKNYFRHFPLKFYQLD